jgi:hypothetical protein
MSIYTLVTQYAGGTYVNQIETDSPRKAVEAWPSAPEIVDVAPYLGIPLEAIRANIAETDLEPRDDLVHVWEGRLLVAGDLLHVTVVETAASGLG